MPFRKVGPDTYKSPSGRKFTQKQVNLYYATDGFKEAKRGRRGHQRSAGHRKRSRG